MVISVSANARLVFKCQLSAVGRERSPALWAACGTVFQTTRPVRRRRWFQNSPVEDRSVVRNCFWSNLAAVLAFAGQPERRSSAWYADTTPDTSDPADAGSGRSHAAPAARACPPPCDSVAGRQAARHPSYRRAMRSPDVLAGRLAGEQRAA